MCGPADVRAAEDCTAATVFGAVFVVALLGFFLAMVAAIRSASTPISQPRLEPDQLHASTRLEPVHCARRAVVLIAPVDAVHMVVSAGPTWTSLTSGAAGSAVTLAGALTVAWLTLRHERRAREREASAAHERDDAVRRRNAAAAISAVHRSMLVEVRWAPLFNGRAEMALLDAAIAETAECGRDHPPVTAWLLQEHQVAMQHAARWRKAWWRFWTTKRQIAERGQQIGEMAGAMASWAAFRIEDEWFEKRLRLDDDRAGAA